MPHRRLSSSVAPLASLGRLLLQHILSHGAQESPFRAVYGLDPLSFYAYTLGEIEIKRWSSRLLIATSSSATSTSGFFRRRNTTTTTTSIVLSFDIGECAWLLLHHRSKTPVRRPSWHVSTMGRPRLWPRLTRSLTFMTFFMLDC